MKIISDLTRLLALHSDPECKIEFEFPTLIASKLSNEEIRAVLNWMYDLGKIKLETDSCTYNDSGYADTYHAWARVSCVCMCLGFRFHGEDDPTLTFSREILSELS